MLHIASNYDARKQERTHDNYVEVVSQSVMALPAMAPSQSKITVREINNAFISRFSNRAALELRNCKETELSRQMASSVSNQKTR